MKKNKTWFFIELFLTFSIGTLMLFFPHTIELWLISSIGFLWILDGLNDIHTFHKKPKEEKSKLPEILKNRIWRKNEMNVLFQILEEHCYYLVIVSVEKNNVPHHAVLHTGFKSGSYSKVWNNTYETGSADLHDVHSIEIIKQLDGPFKNNMVLDRFDEFNP